MKNQSLITIGFSSHRLEVLPALQEEMTRHDALVMEEAQRRIFSLFCRERFLHRNIWLTRTSNFLSSAWDN